ncbi:MAG: type 4a pilus biogenesis protein PilO [bacterium]|nr:type 4a pilus biogenesis protein PilO [bacterium]
MTAKKFFIVMALVLILSIGGGIGVIYYGDKFLSKQSMELAKLKAERDAQFDVIQKIKSATGNPEDLATLRDLTDQVLPAEKKQSDLVADFLFTATTQAGIPTRNIQNISFSGSAAPDSLSGAIKSKDIPGLYEYPFTIQLKNIPYQQLIVFFSELESNKRLITIDNLQITPSTLNPNTVDSLSLAVKTYLKP